MTSATENLTADGSAFRAPQHDTGQKSEEELVREKNRVLFREAKALVDANGQEEQITIGTFDIDYDSDGMAPTKITRLATPPVRVAIDRIISAFSTSNGEPIVHARVVEAKAGWPNWNVENDGYVIEVGPTRRGRKIPIFHIADPDKSRPTPSTNVFGSRATLREMDSASQFLHQIKEGNPSSR